MRELDVLLKMDRLTDGRFETVAGIKARTIAFNAARVDLGDNISAARWLEELKAAGLRRASIVGTGLFKSQAAVFTIREAFFAGYVNPCQVVIPDFGTIEAPFQIVALEFSADHAGEVTFDIAIESAGDGTFVPEPEKVPA